MYVCGIRSEVAGREHRGVGEDSRFNSRFIFKRTRREISLFLARTTFWRGTGEEQKSCEDLNDESRERPGNEPPRELGDRKSVV